MARWWLFFCFLFWVVALDGVNKLHPKLANAWQEHDAEELPVFIVLGKLEFSFLLNPAAEEVRITPRRHHF